MENIHIVSDIIKGSYDLHMHTSPDIHKRILNDYEAASQAKDAGMAGILVKNHHAMTGGRAALVSELLDYNIFGSLTLNYASGGYDTGILKTAISFGIKKVWMPTVDGTMHIKAIARKTGHEERRGISLIDENGALINSIGPILDLIAENNIILGTGHISKEEAFLLIDEAKKRGVKKIVLTHPQADFMDYTEDDILEAVKMGALIEHDFVFLTSAALKVCERILDPVDIADLIRKVGPSNSILATDSGQISNPTPVECMKQLISNLLECGITQEELVVMTHENPKKLLT